MQIDSSNTIGSGPQENEEEIQAMVDKNWIKSFTMS